MKRRPSFLGGIAVGAALTVALAVLVAASSTEKISPVDARPREAYFPNSESLAPDEMRVIACGTGMPTTRAAQAAACFLVELGNGDKFLFDIGSGSAERISSLQIPYDYLDKVFVGHLHGDHFGAIGELFIGGALMGRVVPLRIWGPSGQAPELGTKYAIQKMEEMYTWDLAGRAGLIDFRGYHTEVHEFDYKGVNQVVYKKNGVTIRSWPAIHAGDGPVSYSLEWKGYKVVFGGDTFPNTWFVKYAKNADIVIHEAMLTAEQLRKYYNQPPSRTIMMNTDIHTSAQAFGKVMSMIKPKHAIAYHFFDEEGTRYGIYDGIRETYDGPLSMATDMMVWNLTRKGVEERMAVSTDEAWDVEGTEKGLEADPNRKPEIIWKELVDQRLDMTEVNKSWLDDYKKKHNID
jgi:ribonuclease Z